MSALAVTGRSAAAPAYEQIPLPPWRADRSGLGRAASLCLLPLCGRPDPATAPDSDPVRLMVASPWPVEPANLAVCSTPLSRASCSLLWRPSPPAASLLLPWQCHSAPGSCQQAGRGDPRSVAGRLRSVFPTATWPARSVASSCLRWCLSSCASFGFSEQHVRRLLLSPGGAWVSVRHRTHRVSPPTEGRPFNLPACTWWLYRNSRNSRLSRLTQEGFSCHAP